MSFNLLWITFDPIVNTHKHIHIFYSVPRLDLWTAVDSLFRVHPGSDCIKRSIPSPIPPSPTGSNVTSVHVPSSPILSSLTGSSVTSLDPYGANIDISFASAPSSQIPLHLTEGNAPSPDLDGANVEVASVVDRSYRSSRNNAADRVGSKVITTVKWYEVPESGYIQPNMWSRTTYQLWSGEMTLSQQQGTVIRWQFFVYDTQLIHYEGREIDQITWDRFSSDRIPSRFSDYALAHHTYSPWQASPNHPIIFRSSKLLSNINLPLRTFPL